MEVITIITKINAIEVMALFARLTEALELLETITAKRVLAFEELCTICLIWLSCNFIRF